MSNTFAGGFAVRYVFSNLTSGAAIGGSDSKAGHCCRCRFKWDVP